MHVAKWFLSGLLLTVAVPPATAGFVQIVAFGDSLTDTGNTYATTGNRFPPSPPYFNGRFSNGPTWIEHLAAGIGVPVPGPSARGGANYAFGGAETGTGSSTFGTPNLGTQINQYLALAPVIHADQLFVVDGGANDFVFRGTADPALPIGNLAGHLSTLAAAGARNFLVPNLPPLGDLPLVDSTPQEDLLRQRTDQFNALLEQMLDGLEVNLGITIHRLDVFDLFKDIETNPASLGISNLTETALVNGGIGLTGGPVVTNPDEYLFWDDVHATRVLHQALGGRALEVVTPEPTALVLFGLGSFGAWFARRQWRWE